MKKISVYCIAISLVALLSSCSEDGPSEAKYIFDPSVVCPAEGLNAYGEPMRGTFTDVRDGQTYKYTTIGTQVWMAQNLSYHDETYCLDKTCGAEFSYCIEEPCSIKGRFYRMNEALISCPSGWHLPSMDDWQLLFDNVGGIDSAGIRLKSTSGWTPLNPGQLSNGTDDCGFNLLPISVNDISVNNKINRKKDGYVALEWTGTQMDSNRMLGVFFETQTIDVKNWNYYDDSLLPIRCVKD